MAEGTPSTGMSKANKRLLIIGIVVVVVVAAAAIAYYQWYKPNYIDKPKVVDPNSKEPEKKVVDVKDPKLLQTLANAPTPEAVQQALRMVA